MISEIAMGIYRRTEADRLLSFDIFWLNKNDYLVGFRAGRIMWSNEFSDDTSSIGITCNVLDLPYIRLRYSQTDGGVRKKFDYYVRLVSTKCNYGGKRWWFICPLLATDGQPCRRRVGKLYKDGDYFGCRHCYDLTYSSKNTNYRSPWFSAFSFYDTAKKIEDLEQRTKRSFYAGKPTRNQGKLNKLYKR